MFVYRTESVAEKLLADWLAFNLYHHLQQQPSRVMYRMFLGIKGHLESGPVDVLSGRSANSLSEEKLMRQNVSHAVSGVVLPWKRQLTFHCRNWMWRRNPWTGVKYPADSWTAIRSHRPRLS